MLKLTLGALWLQQLVPVADDSFTDALIAVLVLPLSVAIILLAPDRSALDCGGGAVPDPGDRMLFRTSYKLSDSIAPSTGAVYRRAWRQLLYAGLVVFGAWIGQHWGIVGVSWGALVALTINFVLMAELSLDVARLTWAEFWEAHRPAVLLTLGSFPPVWAVAVATRALHLPTLVILTLTAAIFLLVSWLLVWRVPATFLGGDGQWMMETIRSFLSRPTPAAGARTPTKHPAAPALQATDVGPGR